MYPVSDAPAIPGNRVDKGLLHHRHILRINAVLYMTRLENGIRGIHFKDLQQRQTHFNMQAVLSTIKYPRLARVAASLK